MSASTGHVKGTGRGAGASLKRSVGVKLPASAGRESSAVKRKRVSLSDARGDITAGGVMISLGMIGSGNMARAIVEGVLGQIAPSSITASATSDESPNLKKMKELGINTTTYNRDVIMNSDVIVIAVKPHQVLDVLAEIQAVHSAVQSPGGLRGPGHTPKNLRPLIVSIASSITISDIEQKVEISWNIGGSPIAGHLPVVRCLPNIAACVKAGVTTYTRGKYCNEIDAKPFLSVFSLCGPCEEVQEKYLDAFTAFSGSGVAFMAIVLEAMADGGVLVGIPRVMSQRVAAHTMMSTAKIILERGLHPAELKDAVASPGGTTMSGIQALEQGGLRSALVNAIKAATDRAKELRPTTPHSSSTDSQDGQ